MLTGALLTPFGYFADVSPCIHDAGQCNMVFPSQQCKKYMKTSALVNITMYRLYRISNSIFRD